jgi:uncharacterized protein YqeY
MSMNDTLTADMKTAMKAKDKLALTTIRALKSAIKNAAIEQGGADTVLDDTAIIGIIRKQVKQRLDSIEQFTAAGRSELAENEQAEILVLEKYLPTAMTEDEINAAVAEVVTETGAASSADKGRSWASCRKRLKDAQMARSSHRLS